MERTAFITLLRRMLLLVFIGVITILICYSCSAAKTVSRYNINLENSIGNIYEAENQQTVLVLNTVETATINTTYENITGTYTVEQKDNVLFLSKGIEGEKKMIFISLSKNEMFWQNKDLILFRWEGE